MIQLSENFNYSKLIRFTLPSIAMMLFISIYGMVDGFFVSNFLGKTAFASINLIFPALQILGGIGAMLGVGGSALTAKTLGEGDSNKASKYFTMMIKLMVITGILFSIISIIFIKPIARLFGASDAMMDDCVKYGKICMMFNLALHSQYTFQNYLIVAEKPKLGLYITLIAGFTNMFLDYLFMGVFHMGVEGAALATGLSQCVGGGIPLVWFASKFNKSSLHFVKTKIELNPMLKACINGFSEMLSSVSVSITGILYNRQLMHYAGEDGVAAYGTIMYAAFIFIAVYMGYSSGSSPIMGYHYGAKNNNEMKNVLKRSLILLVISAIIMSTIAEVFAKQISYIFIGYDPQLLIMTTRAFRICAISFLVMWLNIYASSFFTSLNNGIISAIISAARSLVFPVLCIIIMPLIWGLDGIWFSLVASEILGVIVSIAFIIIERKKYGY